MHTGFGDQNANYKQDWNLYNLQLVNCDTPSNYPLPAVENREKI